VDQSAGSVLWNEKWKVFLKNFQKLTVLIKVGDPMAQQLTEHLEAHVRPEPVAVEGHRQSLKAWMAFESGKKKETAAEITPTDSNIVLQMIRAT
jgi:hypothetical protein